MLKCEPDSVLAIAYESEKNTVVTLHNLSDEPCTAKLGDFQNTVLEEFYSNGVYDMQENAYEVALNGYGFRWFYIQQS